MADTGSLALDLARGTGENEEAFKFDKEVVEVKETVDRCEIMDKQAANVSVAASLMFA